MCDFLKEYQLYSDFLRLNHTDYFHAQFTTPEIDEFFREVRCEQDYALKQKTINVFFFNLRSCDQRDIFVVIKWLVTIHELLPKIEVPLLFEQVMCCLSEMDTISCKDDFEIYLRGLLVKPYLQYLHKLAQSMLLKKQQRGRLRQITLQSSNVQNGSQLSKPKAPLDNQESIYFDYNLLVFAVNQFSRPLTEFDGFLKAEYPYLAKYQSLLIADLNSLLKYVAEGAQLACILPANVQRISQQVEELTGLDTSEIVFDPKKDIIQIFSSSLPKANSQNEFPWG